MEGITDLGDQLIQNILNTIGTRDMKDSERCLLAVLNNYSNNYQVLDMFQRKLYRLQSFKDFN